MLSRLFNAASWPPAGKGLTSLLLFVMCNCDFVTFPCGILGQVWYLIVLIPDLYRLSYFKYNICFKNLLQQGISEPVSYGDLDLFMFSPKIHMEI